MALATVLAHMLTYERNTYSMWDFHDQLTDWETGARGIPCLH